MRMYDLIEKKKQGRSLTGQELDWMIAGFTEGAIPDYQMAAFLMAVCFQGMSEQETTAMTLAMARSGEIADLSAIPGIKVDKHSTGGVGDKTTLIAAPMAAACGIPIAKMSGRGLGFTGGTVDKLESIPGYRTALPEEEFFGIVNEFGISLIGQSGELAVADKKIYALRDVTATVDSLPLIASSIMSKKIAAGADAILLDVKTGSGAFMKAEQDALALAQTMVDIGVGAGKRTAALITDMNQPLGRTAGNAIEVAEAVETLHGNGPADLTELCIHLAGNMLWLADKGELPDCLAMAKATLAHGSAFQKLRAMVQRAGTSPIWTTPKNCPVPRPMRCRRSRTALSPPCRPRRSARWRACWARAAKGRRTRWTRRRASALSKRLGSRSGGERRLLSSTPTAPTRWRRRASAIGMRCASPPRRRRSAG